MFFILFSVDFVLFKENKYENTNSLMHTEIYLHNKTRSINICLVWSSKLGIGGQTNLGTLIKYVDK
jgi:hypothetical protein